jgi:hypothetical protein
MIRKVFEQNLRQFQFINMRFRLAEKQKLLTVCLKTVSNLKFKLRRIGFFVYFLFLLISTLLPQYMRNFGRPCIYRTLDSYRYSVYFLKGNDSRLLNLPQQLEISSFISSDNLSSSCLVYNPTEASRKLKAWKNTLPWIKPHYAIKSNPTMELIKDLANQGAGMDCASKD